MTSTLPGLIAIALYLFCSAIKARQILQHVNQTTIIRLLATLALIFHGFSSFNLVFTESGIDLGFFPVASLIFWFIACIAVVTSLRKPIDSLLVLLFAFSALAVAFSLFAPGNYSPRTDISAGVAVHVVCSILAYAVLSIAALQAVLVFTLEYQLKHKGGFKAIQILPPLQTMEEILFQLIALGLALLTVAIGSGFIFVDDVFAQQLAHKTVFSIIAWLVYAFLMVAHMTMGWRGPRAVRWTLWGFFLLMLGFFGSKFVLELLLERS